MSNPLDFIMQQAQKMQADVSGIEATAESGAGLVQVVMKGNSELKSLVIDETLLTEEKTVLEDLVVAAVNSAYKKIEKLKMEKVGGMAGGLDLQQFFNKG